MYNNFYIKFNYKNIIPFNLKKKKIRIHSNLIANKATAAQGYFFGVKIKFWYYYFGINGLKKDNAILIKNFSNKRLSVFFISNFNMIEGKWMFPKIYEEYYERFSFLKKRKFNIIRLNFFLKKNYSNFFLSLNCKKKNYNFFLYYYNYNNIKKNYMIKKNYNYFKFIIKNSLPMLYKKNKIINKKKKKQIFFVIKKFLNILQFIKIFKSLKIIKYRNILSLLYNLFIFFKYIKIHNIKYNKYNLIKLLFNNFNQKIYKKKFINYIFILINKLKKIYKYKFFYNKFMYFKNFTFWKLNKKKNIYFNNYWLYFNNFNLLNKNNIFFFLRNKKIKKNKNIYSFLKKKNKNKFQYLENYNLYDQWLKLYLLKLLNKKNN